MPPASVSSQYPRTGWWKWAAGAEVGTSEFIGRRIISDHATLPSCTRPAPMSKYRAEAGSSLRMPRCDPPVAAEFRRDASCRSLLAGLQVDGPPDRMPGFRLAQHEGGVGRARGAGLGPAGPGPGA